MIVLRHAVMRHRFAASTRQEKKNLLRYSENTCSRCHSLRLNVFFFYTFTRIRESSHATVIDGILHLC